MEEQTTSVPSIESSSTLISDIGSQFQRSGADLQNIQRCFQDVRETEKVRQEMLRDARTLLQSKETRCSWFDSEIEERFH